MIRYSVLAIVFAGVLGFSSCKKDVKNTPEPEPAKGFTQKALVEKFTTTSCGNCGRADLDIEWFKNHHQHKVISVHYHLYTSQFGGDRMATQEGNDMAGFLGLLGTPSAAISRQHFPGDTNNLLFTGGNWGDPIAKELGNTALCGIALDATAVAGNTLEVKATVKFGKIFANPLRITMLLLEDSVTGDSGYWQANYYDADPNVPELFGRGHPIKNYVHNDVYRKAMSPFWGETIPTQVINDGGEHTVTFSTDISAYRKNHLKVVAFVHGEGNLAEKHKYKVLNVQEVKIGQTVSY